MIKVANLSFKYMNNDKPTLSGMNFEVKEGEFILFLGPSGSGKSTTVLTLNGIIPHSIPGKMEGDVDVCGLSTYKNHVYEFAQKVGIVFQDPEAQFVTMNVEDELVFALENLCYPPEKMENKIINSLKKVKMEQYRFRNVYSLSGGEKQKILLAALLAMNPSVLIFDEPTANLDPVGTIEFFKILELLKRRSKHTIILIEHKLDDLIHLVDRVVAIGRGGCKLLEGTPREVFGEQLDLFIGEGIWVPQTALLAHELILSNIELPHIPLNTEEACSILKDFEPIMANVSKDKDKKTFTFKEELALEVRNLSFKYDDEKPALKEISLKVNKGDFLAIVGANGAGKTTLAKHLVNIIRPPSGKISINGKDILAYSTKELSQKIGYVFQNPEHQFIKDTVKDQLIFGLELNGFDSDLIEDKLDLMLKRFKLEPYSDLSPYMLSHGQKRLLSVATMLTFGQEILILDEPTFGQDMKSANELLDLLKALNREGKTIIIITHDMTFASENADKVVVMSEGKLLFCGITSCLFENEQILKDARLTIPPLLKLSNCLCKYDENWAKITKLEDFLKALNIQ